MTVDGEPMTEDRLATEICDELQVQAAKWKNSDFYDLVATIAYYEACLRAIKAEPLKNGFIQFKVMTFLEMELMKASMRLVDIDLATFRERIANLEKND